MKSKSSLILSYEFYPPKTEEGIKALQETATKLAKTEPAFFSVTFGAGGSTRDGTLETVNRLQPLGIPVAPHLACIGLTRNEIAVILEKYQSSNINRIVALRGDIPSGMVHSCELHYASELVAFIREKTQNKFHIEVAAYPEVHPQAINALSDIISLKNKIAAGANGVITQYFFNIDSYFYFVDQCHKQGISISIIPGIMPITNFSKLIRFSDMCGAEIPRWIRKRLEAYGDDQAAIESFGLEVVFNLCDRLLKQGVKGLHFYTLNHAEASLNLVNLLGLNKVQTLCQ